MTIPALAVALALLGQAGQSSPAPIRLIVDSVEVKSEPPPVVRQGSLYLPVRPVCMALGVILTWDQVKSELRISAPRREAVLRPGSAVIHVDGEQFHVEKEPLVIKEATYLLDSVFARCLPLDIILDRSQNAALVTYVWDKQEVTIEEIVRWPRFMRGRPIIVEGEYRGWRSRGETGPVRYGPPSRRGDWIIRDETGALYVTGRRPKQLDPIEDVGAKVRVEGSASLVDRDDGPVPFIRANQVAVKERPG